MLNLIVIVGITGVQGSSVANAFLNNPNYTIRGTTRDPSSAKAKSLSAKGIEIVQADLDDVASLQRAFANATLIFGVTDFWTIFQDPQSGLRKRPNHELVEYCHDVELQQGKNLADAAAGITTLKRYIFSSMANAAQTSGGKYDKIYHMDSKAKAAEYAQSLDGLKDKFSQIQAPIYFELPWKWGLPTTPRKDETGYRMTVPGPSILPVPFGHVSLDFGKCVLTLADLPPNTNFFAIGDPISWEEYLRIFCASNGLPYGGVDEASYDKFCALLPGGLGHEFAQNVLFAHEFGYEGLGDIVRPNDVGLKMTTFREYCEQTDFSAIVEETVK